MHNVLAGHETSQITDVPFTLTLLHVGVAAIGSAVVRTFPALSVATHSAVRAHVSPAIQCPGSLPVTDQLAEPEAGSSEESSCPAPLPALQTSTLAHQITPTPPWPTEPFCHPDAPAVGVVLLSTLPAWSPATHSDDDGHETAQMRVVPSTSARVHAPAPPVGSVEVRIPPDPSLATQNETEAHETPQMLSVPSTSTRVHAPAPPVGSVEVKIPPDPSVATHSEDDGQETLLIDVPGSIVALDHAAAPPAGLVELNRFPPEAPARQSEVLAHETVSI
jgi:hypothetical protein